LGGVKKGLQREIHREDKIIGSQVTEESVLQIQKKNKTSSYEYIFPSIFKGGGEGGRKLKVGISKRKKIKGPTQTNPKPTKRKNKKTSVNQPTLTPTHNQPNPETQQTPHHPPKQTPPKKDHEDGKKH